jgi:hypothetical protein
MAKPNKRRTVGMTNHPLEEERAQQGNVPPRGQAKKTRGPAHSAGTRRGHRLSRQPGRSQTAASGSRQTNKGTKGGKSSGSRAGLRSSRAKGGGARSTKSKGKR